MSLTNTHILCFVLGWQGGTVHQVAQELGVTTSDIIDAGDARMGELCRVAQKVQWKKGGINGQILKHLGRCVESLKAIHDGRDVPEWVLRASGIHKIVSECYPPEAA